MNQKVDAFANGLRGDPMKQAPTFFSEELQNAVKNNQATLEGVDEARNRVSNDIRMLECYLETLDLKTSFRYPLGKSLVAEDGDDQYIAASLEYGGAASGRIDEEALLWSADSTGRPRLLYQHSRWSGSVDVDAPGGPYFWDEDTIVQSSKPLVEMKFEVRKRMYQHLPGFVQALAESLNVDATSAWKRVLESGEIPF